MTDGLSPKPRGRCAGGPFRGGPLGVNDAASGLLLQSIGENLLQIRCRWRDSQQSARFRLQCSERLWSIEDSGWQEPVSALQGERVG